MKPIQNRALILGLSLLLVMWMAGCGKKGPPSVASAKAVTLPAPVNLTIINEQGMLSWNYDPASVPEPIRLQGFDIFRASLDKEGCEGCPIIFERLDRVNQDVRQYAVKPIPGHTCYFKIQAIGEPDIKSEFSRVVQNKYE